MVALVVYKGINDGSHSVRNVHCVGRSAHVVRPVSRDDVAPWSAGSSVLGIRRNGAIVRPVSGRWCDQTDEAYQHNQGVQ